MIGLLVPALLACACCFVLGYRIGRSEGWSEGVAATASGAVTRGPARPAARTHPPGSPYRSSTPPKPPVLLEYDILDEHVAREVVGTLSDGRLVVRPLKPGPVLLAKAPAMFKRECIHCHARFAYRVEDIDKAGDVECPSCEYENDHGHYAH